MVPNCEIVENPGGGRFDSNCSFYNILLRDTKINKSTSYLIKYIKEYNCYIDDVYTNDK